MKRSYLAAIALALSASSAAFSQDRSRVLDNFSTAKGVNVYRAEYTPPTAPAAIKRGRGARNVDAKFAGTTARLNPRGRRLVESTVMSSATNASRTTRMNVTEGLATRETPMSNSEYSRLLMKSANGMRGFTTGDVLIDSYIVDSSRRYAIDPLLIYSQMHQESSFKLRATSNKGASGLMQLMPATARRLGVTNIYDPKQNIEGGIKYMRLLLDMFGQDVNLALAGYNAGEGAVIKYGNTIPPYSETREYVRRISSRYASISDGSFARNYKKVNGSTAARLEEKIARPLTIEQNAIAIRLPDGRLRLVNQ